VATALSASVSQGVEVPDLSFDGGDVTHLFPFLLNIHIVTDVGKKQITVAMKQIEMRSAEAVLVLVGVVAVGVLLACPFRPCASLESTEDDPRDGVDQARATDRQLGLQSVPLLLRNVRHRQALIAPNSRSFLLVGVPAAPRVAP
jgi:hypothetical protein